MDHQAIKVADTFVEMHSKLEVRVKFSGFLFTFAVA